MIDAGKLRYPVTILTPGTGEDKGRWVQLRRAYADKEDSTRTTVFSSVGLAARTAIFTLRRQTIQPGDIIQWMGQWYYITAWEETERIWLTVTSAAVFPVEYSVDSPDGPAFTGILTEKWLRHEQEKPMATNAICYVLVTPKAMEIEPGSLVYVGDTPYQVLVAHILDQSKNEYEIMRTVDL